MLHTDLFILGSIIEVGPVRGTFPEVGKSWYAVWAVQCEPVRGPQAPHRTVAPRAPPAPPGHHPPPRPSRLHRGRAQGSVPEQIRSTPASRACHTPTRMSTNAHVMLPATTRDDSTCDAVSPLTRKCSPSSQAGRMVQMRR